MSFFKNISNKIKNRSKYRIIRVSDDGYNFIYYVEYRSGFGWKRYFWNSPNGNGAYLSGLATDICLTENMAKEKLEECKRKRTTEVVYEE